MQRRFEPCSGCQVPIQITTGSSKEPKCLDCRRNTRITPCLLCREDFDPLERGNSAANTCPGCKLIYRHTSSGSWIALLASK
jgi:hypothetical protein